MPLFKDEDIRVRSVTIDAIGPSSSAAFRIADSKDKTIFSLSQSGAPIINAWNGTFEQVKDDDGIVSWNRTGASFPNGFGDTRNNQVFRMGWNANEGGGLTVVNEPYIGIEMEDYFVANAGQVGTGQMEFHISYVNKNSVLYRPLTFSADRATDFIDMGFRADHLTLLRRSDAAQLWQYQTDGGNGYPQMLYNKGAVIAGNTADDGAIAWSINASNGQMLFPSFTDYRFGSTGQTGAFVINGKSTQGPNIVAINNENGVIFTIGATGGMTLYSDAIAQGNTWIFGTGQMMRLQNGTIFQFSTGNIGWSLDTHAYDTIDTNISRSAAGVVAIGTGAQGSAAGTLYCSTVKFSTALVAKGAGSAATLGNTGGSGPTTAAQNSWLQLVDSTGASFWVPVWK